MRRKGDYPSPGEFTAAMGLTHQARHATDIQTQHAPRNAKHSKTPPRFINTEGLLKQAENLAGLAEWEWWLRPDSNRGPHHYE